MACRFLGRWLGRRKGGTVADTAEETGKAVAGRIHVPVSLVLLDDLGFEPQTDEVIYVEGERSEAANRFMRTHLGKLREELGKSHFRLIYPDTLPGEIMAEEGMKRYWFPKGDAPESWPQLNALPADYLLGHLHMPWNRPQMSAPALWSYVCDKFFELTQTQCRLYMRLELNPAESDVEPYIGELVRKFVAKHTDATPVYSGGALYRRVPPDADDRFETESGRLMEEARCIINRLRCAGISEVVISGLLKPSPELSRLRITADNRIFLTDFSNREVLMTPLVKAVFFLFLRHPEGIPFKLLADHACELSEIYVALRERKPAWHQFRLKHRISRSIERLTDPTDNSINEKCARIREAFLLCVHEDIARHYFVTGRRGEPKRIVLPQDMIDWDGR